MSGRRCKGRKHTPIVSKAQRRLFGAMYRRGELGKAVFERHMKESRGKRLPERVRRKKRR